MRYFLTAVFLLVMAAFICGCGGSSSSSITSDDSTESSNIPIDASGLDNADSVPVDSPFSFKLMRAVLASTVTEDTFYLALGTACNVSARLSANITISDNNTSLNMAAISPLEFSKTYTICITSRILYEDGSPIMGWSFTFTTVGQEETAAPQISEMSPVNGATSVSINSAVWIKFNTAMDSATISSSTFTLASDGGSVSGSVSYATDTYTATFTPTSSLDSLTVYTATISPSIKSAEGVNLVASSSWTFTTEYIDNDPHYTATPSIGTGYDHACALLANGTVKCWGKNEYGQLGRGIVNSPTQSASAVTVKNQDGSTLTDVVELVVGKYTNYVRISDGTVRAWGYNGPWASLGDGGPTDFHDTTHFAYPVSVVDNSTGLAIAGVTSLKAYYTDACAVVNGGVKCWGPNGWGQAGVGYLTYYPYRITSAMDVVGLGAGSNVRELVVGGNATCVLTSDNRVKCWGRDTYGSLGQGSENYCAGGDETCAEKTPVYVLTNIDGTQLSDVTMLYFIYGSGCGVLSNGKFYCWGRPQLGSQTGVATENPNLIGMTSLVAGDSSGCGIFYSAVQCWGLNITNIGNVGVGNMSEIRYSTAQNVSTGATAISVAASVSTTTPFNCALLTNHNVECWGGNTYGQLGDGSATNMSTPVKVTDGETGGNLDLTP